VSPLAPKTAHYWGFGAPGAYKEDKCWFPGFIGPLGSVPRTFAHNPAPKCRLVYLPDPRPVLLTEFLAGFFGRILGRISTGTGHQQEGS